MHYVVLMLTFSDVVLNIASKRYILCTFIPFASRLLCLSNNSAAPFPNFMCLPASSSHDNENRLLGAVGTYNTFSRHMVTLAFWDFIYTVSFPSHLTSVSPIPMMYFWMGVNEVKAFFWLQTCDEVAESANHEFRVILVDAKSVTYDVPIILSSSVNLSSWMSRA